MSLFSLLRLLFGDDGPALAARDRRTFLDENHVAHLVGVAFVMRLVLLRAAHGLLHDRVRETALDIDDDGLVVLVADDGALQDALWHGLVPYAFLPAALSAAIVLMRAMSRRTWRTRAVFSSWPVAFWKRRLNCSFFSLANSSFNWSGLIPRASSAFMTKTLPIPRCAGRSAS